jgi:hypothetical protein
MTNSSGDCFTPSAALPPAPFLTQIAKQLSTKSKPTDKDPEALEKIAIHRVLQILCLESLRAEPVFQIPKGTLKDQIKGLEGQMPLFDSTLFNKQSLPALTSVAAAIRAEPSQMGDAGLAKAHEYFLNGIPELGRTNRKKKDAGAFYTPSGLAQELARQLFEEPPANQPLSICDPAAGHGQLLIAAVSVLAGQSDSPDFATKFGEIANKSVTAYDISDLALKVAYARFVLISRRFLPELWLRFYHCDPLENVESLDNRFDYYFANPPFGLKHPAARRLGLNSQDIYGAFLLLAKTLKRNSGRACFIVSDTFLTLESHRPLREALFAHTEIQGIQTLPKASFSASVETVALFLKHNRANLEHCIEFSSLIREKSNGWQQLHTLHRSQALLSSLENQPFSDAIPHGLQFLKKTNGPALCLGEAKEKTFVKLGDVIDIRVGLQTGNNQHYLRQIEGAHGGYDFFVAPDLLTPQELEGLTESQRKEGVDPSSFAGRSLIPFDKGGRSLNSRGQFSNFYRLPRHAIDWSKASVKRLRTKRDPKGRVQSRMQNLDWYFRSFVVASRVGAYSPTFRLGAGGVFDSGCSGLFCRNYNVYALLGILCSTWTRYLFKSSLNHTVNSQADDLKRIPLPSPSRSTELKPLIDLVMGIVDRCRDNENEDLREERRKVDELVYELFLCSTADVQQIGSWIRRRYPSKNKT